MLDHGHAAAHPGPASAAAPRVSASVDVAAAAAAAAAAGAADTSSVDRKRQALRCAPSQASSHQPPPASSAELTPTPPPPTTRDDRRRSLPSDLTQPSWRTTSTAAAAADRSVGDHLRGRSTAGGDDPLAAYRASARRHLNVSSSSSVAHPRHRPSRSSSAAPDGIGHPVIVRTYSGTPPLDHHRHRHRVAVIREEAASEMVPQPDLPPVEAFSFDDILKNVESEVGGALDAIAGICASCRYSPANHYDVHMPPHTHHAYGDVEHDASGPPTRTTTTTTTMAIQSRPVLYGSLDATLASTAIDPTRTGQGQQHHVDLIESAYHVLNHPLAPSSSAAAASPHETIPPMAFIETTASRPTSLTSLPAPEILTELRRTDERERSGDASRQSMDDGTAPRHSSDGRRDSWATYHRTGSAPRRRSSSVLEQFAAWFPWGHDRDITDARSHPYHHRVDDIHQDYHDYPSAERQLRGLLASRGAG